MMRRIGISDENWLGTAQEGRAQGRTVMFVAIDGAPGGLLTVADPIKPSTPAAIRTIHDRGIRIVMLTGDSRATDEAVARPLGLDEEIGRATCWERGGQYG